MELEDCLRDRLAQRDEVYLTGIVGRIVDADETHISYPVRIPACECSLVFRFETAQEVQGEPAHRVFLNETPGPPTRVVSGDIAVTPVDSRLGDHVLATNRSEEWGILPVSHAEHFSRSRLGQVLAEKLRGEP